MTFSYYNFYIISAYKIYMRCRLYISSLCIRTWVSCHQLHVDYKLSCMPVGEVCTDWKAQLTLLRISPNWMHGWLEKWIEFGGILSISSWKLQIYPMNPKQIIFKVWLMVSVIHTLYRHSPLATGQMFFVFFTIDGGRLIYRNYSPY